MAPSAAVSFLAVAVALLGVLLQPAATSPPPAAPARGGGAPENCAGTLYGLYDCTPFLSTETALAGPPASCCSSLRATLATPASICLCHLYGGEFNAVAHVNVDPFRLALLPIVCLAFVPPELPYMCFVGPVPPMSSVPPAPQATLDSVAGTVRPATLPRPALISAVPSAAPPVALPRAALRDPIAGRG